MHHPTDRIAHTTAFVTPVVEHWLEQEIAQWVHHIKDRSDNPSHHEWTPLPRSYISLLKIMLRASLIKHFLPFFIFSVESTDSSSTRTRVQRLRWRRNWRPANSSRAGRRFTLPGVREQSLCRISPSHNWTQFYTTRFLFIPAVECWILKYIFWSIQWSTTGAIVGARCSSVVRAFTHGAMGRWIDHSWWTHWAISHSSHNWCNKGCGMCYPGCGMMHIKEPMLLIGKSSPCGGSRFPLSLSEWSFTSCVMPYNKIKCVECIVK